MNEGNDHFTSVPGGDYGLPRKASGGISGDYDNDGWIDLFMPIAWTDFGTQTNALLRGLGDRTFGVVTDCVIATDTVGGRGTNAAAWGDWDGDGDVDLVVCNMEDGAFFYRNDGHGQFTRLTTILDQMGTIIHAYWGDYDNDGLLDLAVTYWDGTYHTGLLGTRTGTRTTGSSST